MLKGKGLWVYQEKELSRAFQIAPQMGATHVLYKVGHGSGYRNGPAQCRRPGYQDDGPCAVRSPQTPGAG